MISESAENHITREEVESLIARMLSCFSLISRSSILIDARIVSSDCTASSTCARDTCTRARASSVAAGARNSDANDASHHENKIRQIAVIINANKKTKAGVARPSRYRLELRALGGARVVNHQRCAGEELERNSLLSYGTSGAQMRTGDGSDVARVRRNENKAAGTGVPHSSSNYESSTQQSETRSCGKKLKNVRMLPSTLFEKQTVYSPDSRAVVVYLPELTEVFS